MRFCRLWMPPMELHVWTEPTGDEPPPAPKRRKGKKLPNFLIESESQHLLETCRVLVNGAKSTPLRVRALRDQLIVHLGIYMGLRVSEISNLKIEHVDLVSRRCLVFQGKGGKDRYVPIHVKVADLLITWMGDKRIGHVLLTNRKQPMAPVTIAYRMARLGRLAGFGAKLKPHTLRHTAAVRMLESGAGIHHVREFLGHENIAVTNVYLNGTVEGLRDAVDRMS